MIKMKFVLMSLVVLAATGCATIFNGRTQVVQFVSTPDNANVVISNRAGERIHSVVTPATVPLKRSSGFFNSERYTAVVTKAGFKPQIITVQGKVNNWYFANLMFGGVVGMLIVDPASGAMFTLSPSTADASLIAIRTNNQADTSVQEED